MPERKSLETTTVEHRDDVARGPPTVPIPFEEEEEEPELHLKTWLALVSMAVVQYTSLLALVGPPSVLDNIGAAFPSDSKWEYWVIDAVPLVQAALGPFFSSISDEFQARKSVMVVLLSLAVIGAAIAPGSPNIFRLIGASLLIGFGLAAAPLSYAVPSEVVPRRWRSLSQGFINMVGSLGAVTGPLIIGALTQKNPSHGWRKFYWVQTALWGFSIVGILVGYLPPKQRLDRSSIKDRLRKIDWLGSLIVTSAIALVVTGLNLVTVYDWVSGQVLGPLITGGVAFIVFFLYETYGTSHGMVPHELFQGGHRFGWAFVNFCALFFIEGMTFFAILTFYPVLTNALFTTDPLGKAVRMMPLFLAAVCFTMLFGWLSSRFRDIKYCLCAGFAIYTAGLVGLATVQPGQSGVAIGSLTVAGVGLSAPLILILTGVQLSVPHHMIATATALVVSCRTIAASVFVAIYSTIFSHRLGEKLPSYIAKAAIRAGLPPTSVGPFIGAFLGGKQAAAALAQIPGVTPAVLGAAGKAVKHAFADSVRIVFIIAAPSSFLACLLCLLLPKFRERMDHVVDVPLDDAHRSPKEEWQAAHQDGAVNRP